MIHYQFKDQPDGYCMTKEEWITLWANDDDCFGTIFDEDLPGETPYWVGPQSGHTLDFRLDPTPTGYMKGQYRDSTKEERLEMAQEQWDIYNDKKCPAEFREIVHADQEKPHCRKPK